MQNIISGIIMVVFVVMGAVAADFLKGDPAPVAVAEGASKDGAKDDYADDSHGDKKKKKGDNVDPSYKKKSGARTYFDFGRQFVVPVVEEGKVSALVIMDINLELYESDSDGMYSQEAKFRDAIMRELLSLSNDGAFSGQMTDPAKYEKVQKRLLKASRTVKDEITAVLILDIARQEQT